MIKVISSGSRESAFRDFKKYFKNPEEDGRPLLLVDSEGPVNSDHDSWAHLYQSDHWDKPKAADRDSAHMMVECMEAWFLADKDCLDKYYGKGFLRNALPSNLKIEETPKSDVLEKLENSTRRCESKGKYHKGHHAFTILSNTDPARVQSASPHAKKLIETMKELTQHGLTNTSSQSDPK